MSNNTSYDTALAIMGRNFVGFDELESINKRGDFDDHYSDIGFIIPSNLKSIPFSAEELETKREDYLLILGANSFLDGSPVSIRNFRSKFGIDPNLMEPCFYNQDWYEKEDFIDIPMNNEWFLIRQSVFENSRAVDPIQLSEEYRFPTAIRCVYAFFVAWLALGIKLWYHDFVWCSDMDHNGDRIYVGKYNDIRNINKNGFSVHRHLSLRDCYGCID